MLRQAAHVVQLTKQTSTARIKSMSLPTAKRMKLTFGLCLSFPDQCLFVRTIVLQTNVIHALIVGSNEILIALAGITRNELRNAG